LSLRVPRADRGQRCGASRIVAASDFLIYSLACAELMWFTNEETRLC
jgi:hypothetical protein